MLKDKIQNDQIAALKSGDREKSDTLRYILAQIKNKEIDKRSDLTDEEVVNVLRKVAKDLNESIEAFKKGKRNDLVDEYQKQHELVASYLPKEMTDEELKKEIEAIISKNKELYDKNPKAIIGICMKQLRNKAAPERIMKTINSATSKP